MFNLRVWDSYDVFVFYLLSLLLLLLCNWFCFCIYKYIYKKKTTTTINSLTATPHKNSKKDGFMGLWVYVLDDFVPIRLFGLDPFFFLSVSSMLQTHNKQTQTKIWDAYNPPSIHTFENALFIRCCQEHTPILLTSAYYDKAEDIYIYSLELIDMTLVLFNLFACLSFSQGRV